MDETITVGPYTVRLEYDEDATSPFEDSDVPIVIFHRDYDHLSTVKLSDYDVIESYGTLMGYIDGKDDEDLPVLNTIDSLAEFLSDRHGAEVLQIDAYIHGNIAISASPIVSRSWPDQRWDVSHGFGIIFMTREQMLAWHGAKRLSKKMRSTCREAMVKMVEEYSNYLSGDVWWYAVEDEDGETVDSCGSIIGYDWAVKEATMAARYAIEHEIVGPNLYIAGEGNVRSMRLDDELGMTMAYVRIMRDKTTGPHWRAVIDRANIDDRVVLVQSGTLGTCTKRAMEHFVDVVCGESPDWLNVTRVHHYREEVA